MPPATAITIGNFDGVHLGHAALLQAARNAAGENGRVVALCLHPHPATILRPGKAPPRLSTFEQRQRWLGQAGADEVVEIRPTRDFLSQSPEDFIAAIARQFQPKFIIEGPDFRFGRSRAGSIDTLQQFEPAFQYQTRIVQPVEAALVDQSVVVVSSSMIRWLVSMGRVEDAARLLGRPYELVGTVVRGEQRGRSIGTPTANLDAGDLLLPADGIYRGTALRDSREYPAAISVGTKPTFGNHHPRLCEAHLLDFHGGADDYNWPITIRFTHWLRDQLAFSSVDLLIDQLQRDVEQVRAQTV